MAKEIERWFLVDAAALSTVAEALDVISISTIKQGYFESGPTVRVRIQDDIAFLTIKGKSDSGIAIEEFEYQIPVEDAKQMIDLFCQGRIISKTRFRIRHDDLVIELDIFDSGLRKAEVELPAENHPFTPPSWFSEEVTGQFEYSNLYLAGKH